MKKTLHQLLFFCLFIVAIFCLNHLDAQSIPIANAGSNVSFCEGQGPAQLTGSATGGVQPYYYTWWCDTTVCMIDSVNDDDPAVNPGTTTMYYFQVTDFNGSTSAIDSVLVTVFPSPIVDGGPDHEICGDNAPCVILTPTISNASGPYSYNWGPAAGLNNNMILNPCARPMVTTVYGLQVTSGQGCSNGPPGTDSLAMVTVTVWPVPIANVEPDKSICDGDSIQLQGWGTAGGPQYDFSWSPTSGLSNPFIANPMASPSVGTNYTLNVYSNGCPGFPASVFVSVYPKPSPLSITQIGDTLFASVADSGNTYSWCLNGQTIAGAQDSFLVFSLNGIYEAKQVNSWGCASSGSNQIVGLEGGLRVPEVLIYPNPFSTSLALEVKGGWENYVVKLFDLHGKILWKKEDEGTGRMEINLGEVLASGIYFLRVERNGESIANKIIRRE